MPPVAMTRFEVVTSVAAPGICARTASTTLTKLAKSGEVAKAERGYRLPQ